MRLTVSCIIPAWNEAERLPGILVSVIGHPAIDEVIVVDDGSSDGSAEVAERMGATVRRLSRNQGKSSAVAAGIAMAGGELILLLDADLIGLTPKALIDLLLPVRSGWAEVAISLRQNAPWLWRRIGIDYISGERVMRRSLLVPHLPRIAALKGFALEVFLNDLWIGHKVRLSVVELAVVSPSKSQKHGGLRGMRNDLLMLQDILTTVGPVQAVRQIQALRRLRVGFAAEGEAKAARMRSAP